MAKLSESLPATLSAHLSRFERVIPGGTEWNLPASDWMVLQLSQGIAYVIGSKGNKDLPLGGVVLCPPGSKITLTASVLESAVFRGMGIRLESLAGFLTPLERKCLESKVAQQCAPFVMLPAEHATARRLAALLNPENALTLTSRLAFAQLFAELLGPRLQEAMEKGMEEQRNQQEARDRLRWLMKQIPAAELTRLSLADLARQLHCCARHARRLFREEWGCSFPSYVSGLRLEMACQLLAKDNLKIIDVALESGHGSLAHFNYLFKKRFRVTPTEWRGRHGAVPRAVSRSRLTAVAAMLALLLTVVGGAARAGEGPATGTNTTSLNNRSNAAPVATYQIDQFEVRGNTLLSTDRINKTLSPYTGFKANADEVVGAITNAMGALQLEYFQRGYVTVKISYPPQKFSSTNRIIYLQATEGRLAAVRILHNRYFSSNNIMAALPYVQSLLSGDRILNNQIFQTELNRANANPDRQISPELRAGLEPGTTALMLDVKDRIPLHAKLDLDNYSPPGTPELRANANVSYGNLWDLDHTAGFQYGFSPENTKPNTGDGTHVNYNIFDSPEVAYYSGFYRAPLGEPTGVESQIAQDPTHFGYNETTKQFVLPPNTARPEFSAYASRSTTGPTLLGPLMPVVNTPLLMIDQQMNSQQYTSQTTVGGRFSFPLPEWQGIQSTWNFGMDYKNDKVVTLPTNFFYYTTIITHGNGGSSPPTITHTTIGIPGVASYPSLQYTPFTLAWNGSRQDRWGQGTRETNRTSEFDGGVSFIAGLGGVFSRDRAFPNLIANSKEATTEFYAVRPQLSRTQVLPQNFTLYGDVTGQWGNEPLLNLEQFALGGYGSVRGYREGEMYADSGWYSQLELRSPYYWRGPGSVKNLGAQLTLFTDYGQGYNNDSAAEPLLHRDLWGSGVGINFRFGAHIESHILVAWPLLDSTYSVAGHERISFSLSAQL